MTSSESRLLYVLQFFWSLVLWGGDRCVRQLVRYRKGKEKSDSGNFGEEREADYFLLVFCLFS